MYNSINLENTVFALRTKPYSIQNSAVSAQSIFMRTVWIPRQAANFWLYIFKRLVS